jgi:hypothetical protein
MSHSPKPHTNLLNVLIQIANNKGILLKKTDDDKCRPKYSYVLKGNTFYNPISLANSANRMNTLYSGMYKSVQ